MFTLVFAKRPHSFPLPELGDAYIKQLVAIVDALDSAGPLPRDERTGFPGFVVYDAEGEEVGGG